MSLNPDAAFVRWQIVTIPMDRSDGEFKKKVLEGPIFGSVRLWYDVARARTNAYRRAGYACTFELVDQWTNEEYVEHCKRECERSIDASNRIVVIPSEDETNEKTNK